MPDFDYRWAIQMNRQRYEDMKQSIEQHRREFAEQRERWERERQEREQRERWERELDELRNSIKPRRKTRSDKGRQQILSDEEIKQGKTYYKSLLRSGLHKWLRPMTAAKHITEYLERPAESWQTIRDWIVLPVLDELRDENQ
jgi:hypothetical protein